ncbi:MAG: NADH-quinone oxidoreductase subunit N [Candidatus Jettenia sp.]|nr:NADH-quinone oxidoreductase subunit N [Candidatus Jettenia sp. AMX1]MBC6929484.1 NADH-quinone oxidoreductase subunit N [Candidatus Jettenia sp.]NUN22322.1 NADH-quinone oxidoreductase subunit N [Candidatus Jettenia caeni]KAA0249381.1 MAG: NADH-quinone oxidoreductase subunit N [Candidatus Jettenia sp. AMX1]MCE7880950.1 NADH-quinone oxidoreductase subunit N [Candidatus Jettenia sp. AMX1]MCQ3927687.1 NADH-quinone oxidoreductase subunit N [Candidatus Jettenia sp.]
MANVSIMTFNILSILPILTLAGFGMIVLLVDILSSRKLGEKNLLAYLSLMGIIVAAILARNSAGTTLFSFNESFAIDNYSLFFNFIFLLSTGLVILISHSYIKREEINHGEYYALILFSTIGMMLMASGADLLNIYIGLEVMSISIYILTGFKRSKLISNEASLKYFLLGAFATGFLLYGISLVYGSTGAINLKQIAGFIADKGSISNPLLLMGMALIIIGLGFKVASVPFHAWVPDVYEGAPTTITAFMSVGPKAAAFAAFLRILMTAFGSTHYEWQKIIYILALLTMTVGNVVAIAQTNLKRMLAYSSIAHAGYLLIALVAANDMGVSSVLFYILAYTFMNIGALAVVIIVSQKGDEFIQIHDFAGLGFKHPGLAVAMSLFMLSMAGIPPTAGFVGKFYIFSAAIKSGYIGLAVIGVINSVISVFYYLRIMVIMYMKEPTRDFNPLTLSPLIVVAVVLSVIGTLHLGIFPSKIMEIAQQSILILK